MSGLFDYAVGTVMVLWTLATVSLRERPSL